MSLLFNSPRELRPLLRLGVLTLVLLASPERAFAASTSTGGLSVTLLSPSQGSFSKADCTATTNPNVSFRWSMSAPFLDGDSISFFIASDSSCSSSTVPLRQAVTPAATSGTFPEDSDIAKTAYDLFSAASFGSGACSDPGIRQSMYVCAVVTNPNVSGGGFGNTNRAVGSVAVALNSKPPLAPIELEVDPLDEGALVSWKLSPAETDTIAAFNIVATPSEGTPIHVTTTSADDRTLSLTGLTNGMQYQVSVTAVDTAGSIGNEGPAAVGLVTPVVSQDFLEKYREGSGHETGGCSSSGASLAALAVLFLMLRRRRLAATATAAALLLSAQTAAAETRPSCGELCLSLQIDGGPYIPNIDSEKGLTGNPYATIFGHDAPWMGRLTLGAGWRTISGTWSVALAGGMWSVSGHSRSQDARNVATADKVSLSLTSVTPLLSWRGQFIYDRWHFPLVPFVQAGYGFVSWRTTTNDQVSTSGEGSSAARGEGWGQGLEGSAGLILFLDGFDETGSTAFLHSYGLASTGIVASYSMTRWQGRHGLILGDDGFQIGLLFLH